MCLGWPGAGGGEHNSISILRWLLCMDRRMFVLHQSAYKSAIGEDNMQYREYFAFFFCDYVCACLFFVWFCVFFFVCVCV